MSFWRDRNSFITGATGFVGSHIARALIEQGARVFCLERGDSSRSYSNSLDNLGIRAQVTVINGKVEDFALMERIINEYKIDAVFHLAAQALVGAANLSPLSTFETNIRGTYTLLEACRISKTVKRIVVASSDKAYGTSEKTPSAKNHSLDGLYPYEASKVCTDVLARSFAYTYNTPVVVTRFANIYGPGDLNISRIVPGTIVSVLKNESPIIRSDGTPKREFVFADDVARAYLMLAEKIEDVQGEAFNFGSGEPIQMLDLVQRIIKFVGKEGEIKPNILVKKNNLDEFYDQHLGSEKATKILKWKPEININEGLKRTISWYEKNLEKFV